MHRTFFPVLAAGSVVESVKEAFEITAAPVAVSVVATTPASVEAPRIVTAFSIRRPVEPKMATRSPLWETATPRDEWERPLVGLETNWTPGAPEDPAGAMTGWGGWATATKVKPTRSPAMSPASMRFMSLSLPRGCRFVKGSPFEQLKPLFSPLCPAPQRGVLRINNPSLPGQEGQPKASDADEERGDPSPHPTLHQGRLAGLNQTGPHGGRRDAGVAPVRPAGGRSVARPATAGRFESGEPGWLPWSPGPR